MKSSFPDRWGDETLDWDQLVSVDKDPARNMMKEKYKDKLQEKEMSVDSKEFTDILDGRLQLKRRKAMEGKKKQSKRQAVPEPQDPGIVQDSGRKKMSIHRLLHHQILEDEPNNRDATTEGPNRTSRQPGGHYSQPSTPEIEGPEEMRNQPDGNWLGLLNNLNTASQDRGGGP